jgi:hypothetical protein
MLVKIACETNGEVKDCLEVIAASNKYRQGQDAIAGFINDKIVKDIDGSIGKKILNDVFKEWFQNNLGNRRPPKLAELEEILNNTFGNRNVKTNKWHGIRINYDDENEDAIDNL